MRSNPFIPINRADILKVSHVVITYKPVPGTGVFDNDYADHFTVFNLIGYNPVADSESTIAIGRLKDYANTGFDGFTGVNDYITALNESGNRTLLVIETGDLSPYTALYYELSDEEYINEIIDIALIFSNKQPVPA